jgi:phosphoglycerol transferase MdoB-like AlkP superfamily enzyme
METINDRSFFKSKVAWLILILIALVAFAMVALPVWMIQPFRPQSQRGLEISYALRRWSPMLTIISLALVIMLLLWLWTVSRGWWRKALLVVIVIPLLAATWFARQNHFEWMFNPLANATYAKASAAQFVNDGDIVMTVEKNGEAAAYPIRLMAYHHLVQDIVGGTPIVATY